MNARLSIATLTAIASLAFSSHAEETLVRAYRDFGTSVHIDPPALSLAEAVNSTATLEWDAVETAVNGYRLDVSDSPDFSAPGMVHHFTSATNFNTLNGWTVTNVTTYIRLFEGFEAVSPPIDLTNAVTPSLTFNARTYGGVIAERNRILVEASVDGDNWTIVGDTTPTSSTLAPITTPLDLTPWCGDSVYLRLTAPDSTSGIGAGVCEINVYEIVPDFIAGYDNRIVIGTTETITNLTPLTAYYARIRSVGDSATSTNSAVLQFTPIIIDPGAISGLLVPSVADKSARIRWNSVNHATGYELQVYHTNNILNIGSPRVIITKVIQNGNNRGVEITNIGNAPVSDITGYSFKRLRVTSDNDWNWAVTLGTSTLPARNGASATLKAGESILLTYVGASGGVQFPSDEYIADAKGFGGNDSAITFGNNNLLGIFDGNGVLLDTALTISATIQTRDPYVTEGKSSRNPDEWTQTVYNNNNAGDIVSPHYIIAPVQFPSGSTLFVPLSYAETVNYSVFTLHHSTEYSVRVRANGGGNPGPWSAFVLFTTTAPPKTTLVIVK